jgi:acyl-CoA thioester hydrolase
MNSIKECPIVHHQQVAWGDMDAFGHVNNVMYYRYIESARIEYLTQVEAFNHGLVSVVSSSSCRFYRPVFYPDLLKIGARVVEIRNSGFRMAYVIYSNQQGQMVATGEAIVVMVDANTFEKAALPMDLRQRIAKLEASVGHDLQISDHHEKNRLSEIGRALRENLDQIVPKIGK